MQCNTEPYALCCVGPFLLGYVDSAAGIQVPPQSRRTRKEGSRPKAWTPGQGWPSLTPALGVLQPTLSTHEQGAAAAQGTSCGRSSSAGGQGSGSGTRGPCAGRVRNRSHLAIAVNRAASQR